MAEAVPFEQWYHDLHGICGQYDGVPRKGQRDVRGCIGVHAFDTLDVADVSGDVAQIKRDRAGIRRDDAEHVFLVVDIDGETCVDHNGQRSRLARGDCVLLDSTKEGNIFMAEASSRVLSVHLPRQTFLGDRQPGVRIGHRLPSDHAATRMLLRHFFRFFREDGEGELSGNVTLLFDMIHAAFSAPERGVRAAVLSREADRFEVAIDLIDSHLTGDYLTLPWLAREMGLSERQTQRVFADRDTSFTATVRAKRFRYVTEHLDRIPAIHGRISEIAYGAGFQDLSNFNRGFKARYGLSPRAYHETGLQKRLARRRAPDAGSRHAWREMHRFALSSACRYWLSRPARRTGADEQEWSDSRFQCGTVDSDFGHDYPSTAAPLR